MNSQLIKEIITVNDLPCPEFTFQNPLLDKNVAKALSKSFVKILNLSQQKLRIPVLENIRKLCQTQPQNHMNVDENTPTLLSEFYTQKIEDSNHFIIDSAEKELDAFLIRNLKDKRIISRYEPSLNPEIVQAFRNLNEANNDQNAVWGDIIHWNIEDNKNAYILKDMWTSDSIVIEDIAIKLKSELEQLLLQICYDILKGNVADIKNLFVSNASLMNLSNKSSNSANCFQICCSILHYIFVITNFNKQIYDFIQLYIEHVKCNCSKFKFSILYQPHLMHIVVLLNVGLELLDESVKKEIYIEETVNYLKKLHSKSKDDLIMLLSHFPQWYDIYFKIN